MVGSYMTQCTVSDRLESYTPQLLAFAPIHGSSSFSGLFLYAALSRIAVMFASDKNRAIKCNKVGRLDCCRIAVRRVPSLGAYSSKIENVESLNLSVVVVLVRVVVLRACFRARIPAVNLSVSSEIGDYREMSATSFNLTSKRLLAGVTIHVSL